MTAKKIENICETEDVSEMSELISTGNKKDWITMLCFFEKIFTKDNIIDIIKNSNEHSENEKYDVLSKLRFFCNAISADSRSIGTLMKNLNID